MIKKNIMSLDVSLYEHQERDCECGKGKILEKNWVHDSNITHNLGKMAEAAGIYEALWRPHKLLKNDFDDYDEEMEFESHCQKNGKLKASLIIPILEVGLKKLKRNRVYYKKFDSPNGWGLYVHFVPFVEDYLKSCKKYPGSYIEVSR